MNVCVCVNTYMHACMLQGHRSREAFKVARRFLNDDEPVKVCVCVNTYMHACMHQSRISFPGGT